jgi:peptide subunit release factor RF-3
LYQYASNISEYKQSDFKLSQLKKDDSIWPKIINGYTALFSDLTDAEQAILEEIYANIGNLSFNELKSKLNNELEKDANSELYRTITAQWYDSNYSQTARWIGAYNSTEGKSITLTGDFADGLDFENWRKIKEKAAKDSKNKIDIEKYSAENAANLYDEYY